MTNKRMLAFVLALLMCLTILPAGVLAADDGAIVEVPGGTVANAGTVVVGDCTYIVEGTATLSKYTGTGGAVVIPETVSGCNVTKIAESAFFGSAITEVEIPSKVNTLGNFAFGNCDKLEKVTIKGNIKDCTDENAPFDKAGKATLKVTFNEGVTKIPANIFKGSNVKTVSIPKTVITIGENAFDGCFGLTTLSFPGGNALKTIGAEAFSGCKALTSISLPKSCTSVGDNAFEDCRGLTSITIAGNIGNANNVFKKAGADATITFKSTVTSVSNIFETPSASYAPKVIKILFESSAPSIYANAFANIEATVTYNSSDTSWNGVANQNYGGKLTWNGVAKAKVTTDPSAVTVKEGEKATFKVKASGSSLKYQWQLSTDGGKTFSDISGATKSTYTITSTTASMNGRQFRCKVSNELGTATSKAAKLTVLSMPSITTQPSDLTVKEGKTGTVKVKASGGNLKYQWYYQEYGTTIWTSIKGATKSSYTIKATRGLSGYKYRCKVSNTVGTKYSHAAKLTVLKKPKVTKQPSSKTVKVGNNVTFKVTASGAGLKYQWYKRKGDSGKWTAVAFAQSDTLTLSSVKKSQSGYQYRCRVYNDVGVVYSNAAKLIVKN